MVKYNKKTRSGAYVTLISVLIVSSIGLSIAISLMLLGIGTSRNSLAVEQANQAKTVANACAETALRRIRFEPGFAGSDSIAIGQGMCSYTVTNLGGDNRDIDATGTVGTIVRKVQISVNDIDVEIGIGSWKEVVDF